MAQDSTLIRVYADDKEKINRIVGVLKARSAEHVTAGDVVAVAVQALMATRPDLATHPDLVVRANQAAQP